MNSIPRVSGDRPLVTIGYNCKYWKTLGFISTEGDGSNDTGGPYLYLSPDTYSNVSVCIFVLTIIIGIYFNNCNAINKKCNNITQR